MRLPTTPPPLVDYNVFEADAPLVEAVRREGSEWAMARISAVGELAGSERILASARRPTRTRRSCAPTTAMAIGSTRVEFHPSWHELLGRAVEHELHCSPWKDPRPGAHVARGGRFMCMSQAEAGDSAARSR